MILKEIDDKSDDIAALERLAALAQDQGARRRIEAELAKIRSGAKGERDAAYHLDFRFGKSENAIVIHDLRLSIGGRVAQIDHFVMDRFLHGYVCESKRFGEGIAINDHGECSAFYKNKPYGIPSPFEQNNRHISVLREMWDSNLIELPSRLGIPIIPALRSVVLVSTNARITRSRASPNLGGEIVKADQFGALYDKDTDRMGTSALLRIVSSETLERFGREIVRHHRPVTFNWQTKFGVESVQAMEPERMAQAVAVPNQPQPTEKRSKLACETCGQKVEYAVAKFCWFNKAKYSGLVYCRDHQ